MQKTIQGFRRRARISTRHSNLDDLASNLTSFEAIVSKGFLLHAALLSILVATLPRRFRSGVHTDMAEAWTNPRAMTMALS